MKIQKTLPEDHRPTTDKYFPRTRQILEAAGINPIVSMKVFARGEGEVVGLEETVEALTKFSDIEEQKGEIWVTKNPTWKTKDSLVVIKAPIQSYVELETMELGILSYNLSEAVGLSLPNSDDIREQFRGLKEIYGDIPMTYFGARHYHWSLDKEIAKAGYSLKSIQSSLRRLVKWGQIEKKPASKVIDDKKRLKDRSFSGYAYKLKEYKTISDKSFSNKKVLLLTDLNSIKTIKELMKISEECF